ncbi:MAG: DUF421 domain-containing protein [Ornithinimicrobium sp.]|uniref:DUF421 domain-containing protein n=1 Tax=Ornithinimicrobium sp. TaxID=1977084 RepID=UPI0026DFEC50|nr:YetF domain-containing protein [Ornithinimicrobium sp.]MDO5738776.1 DUF421 domain-containing protein [Ornithinimicrobium sp.]
MQDLWYYLGIPPLAALAVVISTVLLYASFIFLSRLLGQRVLARLSGFDLLVVIVFGAVIGRAILGHIPTLAGGLVAMVTLLALEASIGQITKNSLMERMVNNRPVLLMAGDQFVAEEMHRCHVTVAQVRSQLRRSGIRAHDEVAAVILEPTGELSVLKRGVLIEKEMLRRVRSAERMPADLLTD